MAKFLLATASLLYSSFSFSQMDNFQKDINDQVWKPFIKSFNNDDNEGFRAVHSKEVTRVIQDDNRLLGYDEYFKEVPDSVKAKWGNWKKILNCVLSNASLQRIKLLKSATIKVPAPMPPPVKKELATESFTCC